MKKRLVSLLMTVAMLCGFVGWLPAGNTDLVANAERLNGFIYYDADVFAADALRCRAMIFDGVFYPAINEPLGSKINSPNEQFVYEDLGDDISNNYIAYGSALYWQNLEKGLKGDFVGMAKWRETMFVGLIMDYLAYEGKSEAFKTDINDSSEAFLSDIYSELGSWGMDYLKHLPKEEAQKYAKQIKWAKDLDEVGDKLDKAARYAETGMEYFQNVSKILAVKYANDNRILFLKEMKKAASNDKDICNAIDKVIGYYENAATDVAFDYLREDATEFIVKEGWNKAVKEIIPKIEKYVGRTAALNVQASLTALNLGTTGMEWLFNSSDISTATLEAVAVNELGSYAEVAYQNIRDDYSYSTNKEYGVNGDPVKARAFLSAFENALAYKRYANTIADKYYYQRIREGVLNKTLNLFTGGKSRLYNDWSEVIKENNQRAENWVKQIDTYRKEYYKWADIDLEEYYKIPVSGIRLENSSITLDLKNILPQSVKVYVEPSSASNPKVNYTSSNTKIVTVYKTTNNSQLSLMPVSVGTATVTAVTEDGGYKAVLNVTVIDSRTTQTPETDASKFSYTIKSDNTVEITKYNGSDTNVIIPKKIGGKTVTSIGNKSFYKCTNLKSINIPDSVTSIDSKAFEDCTSLTSITIPNSVTSIDDQAFSGCTSLVSITIPNNVTSIGLKAFYDCTSLTSITIPNSVTRIGGGAFYGTAWLKAKQAENPLVIVNNILIDGKISSGDVTIPNSVTSIGNEAFSNCTSLTSITIPNSVTIIGGAAFYGCTSLTSITIPNSVTSIGSNAFFGCRSLTRISIPSSVTSIGGAAFENCTSLTSITIPNSVTSIGYYAFCGCTSLASIIIPNSVTSIGNFAFYDCTSLTSITIPNSVTIIGYAAFEYCKSLTSITIPNSVTSIRDYAFEYCKSLTSITIPNSVTSIRDYAFGYCTSLTSITIPNSVTTIGNGAFSHCTSLTSITIPNSVTSICNHAFDYCRSLTSITIPNSVTSICDYAFGYCTSLTSITIPDSVTDISNSAFYGCTSLSSITISKRVTRIGTNAFGYYYDYGVKKIENFKIYCYKDTAGEQYAKENGFAYELLDGKPVHTHSYKTTIVAPTYTEKGYTLYYCEGCGHSYKDNYKDKLSPVPSLSYVPGDGSVKLTWTKIGIAQKYEVCGYVAGKWQDIAETTGTSYVLNDLKSGQNYKVAVIVMINGKWNTDFSNAITVTPKVHTHSFTTKTVAPTYTEKGYTLHTCQSCGYSYKDNYKDKLSTVPTVSYVPGDGSVKLTWTKIGIAQKYEVCGFVAGKWQDIAETTGTSYVLNDLKSGQNYKVAVIVMISGKWNADFSNAIIVTPKHTHSYTSKITKQPTCTSTGILTYTCSCGDKYTESIPAKVHQFSPKTITPTCTEKGYTLMTCKLCGYSYKTGEKPASGHNYTEKIVAPTYKERGYTLHSCSKCGHSFKDNYKDKLSPAPEISYTPGDGCVKLTWTSIDGAEKYAVCGYVAGKWREIAKGNGNSYVLKDLKSDTEYTVAVISKINGEWFVDLSKAITVTPNHIHSYTTKTVAPTYTERGYTLHYCSGCGHSYKDNYKDKIPPIPSVSYVPGNGAVELTWTKIDIAQKYGVCGYVSGKWQSIAEVKGTSYILNDLKSGTNYKVAVITMINGKWNTDFSNAIIVTPKVHTHKYTTTIVAPTYAEQGYTLHYCSGCGHSYKDNYKDKIPPIPTVSYVPGNGAAKLTWTNIDIAQKYCVCGYVSGKWQSIAETTGTSYIMNGLESGTDYKVSIITMINGKWNTDFSNAIVVKTNDVVPTKISLSPTSYELKVGETVQLTATVSPSNAKDKSVSWSSSNTNVVTLSNGRVTGVSAGSATITAKSSNGLIASCLITIKDVTTFDMDNRKLELDVGKSCQIRYEASSTNDNLKTSFSSSNTNVATVDSSGYVTAKKYGKATITGKFGDYLSTIEVIVHGFHSATNISIPLYSKCEKGCLKVITGSNSSYIMPFYKGKSMTINTDKMSTNNYTKLVLDSSLGYTYYVLPVTKFINNYDNSPNKYYYAQTNIAETRSYNDSNGSIAGYALVPCHTGSSDIKFGNSISGESYIGIITIIEPTITATFSNPAFEIDSDNYLTYNGSRVAAGLHSKELHGCTMHIVITIPGTSYGGAITCLGYNKGDSYSCSFNMKEEFDIYIE